MPLLPLRGQVGHQGAAVLPHLLSMGRVAVPEAVAPAPEWTRGTKSPHLAQAGLVPPEETHDRLRAGVPWRCCPSLPDLGSTGASLPGSPCAQGPACPAGPRGQGPLTAQGWLHRALRTPRSPGEPRRRTPAPGPSALLRTAVGTSPQPCLPRGHLQTPSPEVRPVGASLGSLPTSSPQGGRGGPLQSQAPAPQGGESSRG